MKRLLGLTALALLLLAGCSTEIYDDALFCKVFNESSSVEITRGECSAVHKEISLLCGGDVVCWEKAGMCECMQREETKMWEDNATNLKS